MSDGRGTSHRVWESRGLDGQPPDNWDNWHDAGCTYGGFSCGYWLIVDGCSEEHWERHYALADDRCPCGTLYPGVEGPAVVVFDATAKEKAS
jgi:hypothetical protein